MVTAAVRVRADDRVALYRPGPPGRGVVPRLRAPRAYCSAGVLFALTVPLTDSYCVAAPALVLVMLPWIFPATAMPLIRASIVVAGRVPLLADSVSAVSHVLPLSADNCTPVGAVMVTKAFRLLPMIV